MSDERPIRHFPEQCSIKAVGRQADDFAEFVAAIVRQNVDAGSAVDYRTRNSRNGAYLSVTLSFIASSQQQLDNVFAQVSAAERVLWVL